MVMSRECSCSSCSNRIKNKGNEKLSSFNTKGPPKLKIIKGGKR